MSDDSRREVARIRDVYWRRQTNRLDERYSLFAPAHLFQTQSLERVVLRELRRREIGTLSGARILDVGCGGGGWLSGLVRYGANPSDLTGIDLRSDALPAGSERARWAVAAADGLPFRDSAFDIVCQLTMMSSVLDRTMRTRIAREMVRVLRPGGLVLWYDFTANPTNPDVAGIRPAELRRLFGDTEIRWQRVTLAPPVTRLLAPRSWMACQALESFPWLRTHILATCRRLR